MQYTRLDPLFIESTAQRIPVAKTRLLKEGRVEIWEVTGPGPNEYFVYGVTASGDPTVCPSLDMARSVAASAL